MGAICNSSNKEMKEDLRKERNNLANKKTSDTEKESEPIVSYFPMGRSIMISKHEVDVFKQKRNIKEENSLIKISLCLKKFRVKNKNILLKISLKKQNNIALQPSWDLIFSCKIDLADEIEFDVKNSFNLEYFFELEQVLLVEVIYDTKTTKKEISVASIISSGDVGCFVDVRNEMNLFVKGIIPKKEETQLEFDIYIVHKKPIGKELFYLLSNTYDESQLTKVFKSEEVFPGEGGDWIFSKTSLPKSFICFDNNQKIVLQIMEFTSNKTTAREIFSTEFTVNNVLGQNIKIPIEKNSIFATLHIGLKEIQLLNFVDYVAKGLNINLIVAIDYTGSNMHPLDVESLHYIKSSEPTQYEKAIRACGNILAPYDDDQLIPVYGFGGIPPGKLLVEHVFPLKEIVKKEKTKSSNFNKNYIKKVKQMYKEEGDLNNIIIDNNINDFEERNLEKGAYVKSVYSKESDDSGDENKKSIKTEKHKSKDDAKLFVEDSVYGLEGVIKAYKKSVSKIVFSGPTHFSPILEKVRTSLLGHKNLSPMDYFILLIITDGQINDLKQTINSIVTASDLPLSIVIVGVGDDDFESMRELDGDDFPLTNYNNRVTGRDIVQFVPFNQFKDNIKALGQEILKEVPLQVESYFHFSNINLS